MLSMLTLAIAGLLGMLIVPKNTPVYGLCMGTVASVAVSVLIVSAIVGEPGMASIMIWMLVLAFLVNLFRMIVERGDQTHWLKRIVHLAMPTHGVEIDGDGRGGAGPGPGPGPEPEPGRNQDSQGYLGLIDAILSGGPPPQQGERQPQQDPGPPQQEQQAPGPEEYVVNPDEEGAETLDEEQLEEIVNQIDDHRE